MAAQARQLEDRVRQHFLDLNLRHFHRQVGDLTVTGTWVGTEEYEPAIVLLPAYRHAKPCIIALSAAFKYDDPRYLAHSARAFGKILGLTDDLATTAKLADLIHESLTDLLKIPPMPTTEKVVGEVEVQTADGRRTSFDMIVHDPGHA